MTLPIISTRWIREFQKQLQRRSHILLYGNIHDPLIWRGNYLSIHDFLSAYFQDLDFDLTLRYDSIDGFRFPNPDLEQRFNDLAQQQLQRRHSPAVAPPAANGAPPRANPGAVLQQRLGNAALQHRLPPEEAFGQLRTLVKQTDQSLAAVIDLADMLTADPDRYGQEERNPLILIQRCTLEANILPDGPLQGYRNTLVVLASDLKRVPVWFYTHNPYLALVQVTYPNKAERQYFIQRFGGNFYGGQTLQSQSPDGTSPSELQQVAEEFADLTDGFQTMDLEALRLTSVQQQLPLNRREVMRLVDFYKFGQREEPFEQLSREKVSGATRELSQAVIGQPRAITAVTDMLMTAKVGISLNQVNGRNSKPKGIFFFVGPTGVGKTELAKSLSRLIFGDKEAFARFDMSEYKEEHSAEKLAGSPPGFVGYEEGGQLTNRVLERPYSILLFDEIEKAHPRVLDKFLQILEDGRLTDGKGRTAYFNQTVIVFTSNIGASDLTDPQTGALLRSGIMTQVQQQGTELFSYEQVNQHFREEVRWYFSSRIGRAELLNRFGDNIVVFDLLRPEFVSQIGDKFLGQLRDSAAQKYGLMLQFDESVMNILTAQMQQGENLLFGGRRVKTMLESWVERPLNRWLFQEYGELSGLRGSQLRVSLTDSGELRVLT
ncbi:AAA family ATPase [Laspinema olomoucense]|uniref:AAA family ATPase n=1 Tax=Laspinema olomoucense TaxID=3231600 RepID=UPI0021BA6C95|nr:AAA family ATPase [Laspinema sp. D3d]MCT7973428.1 AAA family ATPase [Laspinema sp. D3d]